LKLLLVDDDPDMLAVTGFALQQAGYLVLTASSFESGLRTFRAEQPSLAILDINLPGGTGLELCRLIRQESQLPILMLTARSEESDLVHALELAADDYMTKPFSPRTLVARVKALLRRAGGATSPRAESGDLRLDVTALELHVGGHMQRLTPLEARLLQLLVAHHGQAVQAERLLAHIWGQRGGGDRQLLKQLVHRLRLKLESAGLGAVQVETVPSVGYRLRA
jgi:DNA-binding response OmpR family regulator